MIYLDNAATSFPKPHCVSEAITRFLETSAANPGRASHRMSVAAAEILDATRDRLTKLFDGSDSNRMILTLNCTDALNMAIKGVVLGSKVARPHVVTTVTEHNSVLRPIQALARLRQIEVTFVDCDENGFVDPDDVKKAIRADTILVVISHASNVLGTIQDISRIGSFVRESGALLLVDAAQTAGVVPLSIRSSCIDLLAFPGHKGLLGPTGTGGLFVGERCPTPLVRTEVQSEVFFPWREGGTGGDSTSEFQPPEFPDFLEGGTANTVGNAGLLVSLELLLENSLSKTLLHERSLVQRVVDELSEDERFVFYGLRPLLGRVGTLSFNLVGFDPTTVAAILDDSFEIAVRAGLHCAPRIHQRIGTFPSGTVRCSPGAQSTVEEIVVLVEALREIARK